MSEPTIPPKCDACGRQHTPGNTNIRVVTTNGDIRLCMQCLSDIIRKNPELTAIRELLTPLLGTETCPVCFSANAVIGASSCTKCSRDESGRPTGHRNIADGLSVVECVRRLAEWWDDDGLRCSFDDGTTGTRGDAWKKSYKEMRAKRDELREQVKRLRERVERRLQTCHARGICVDCEQDREVLTATAPKEPVAK